MDSEEDRHGVSFRCCTKHGIPLVLDTRTTFHFSCRLLRQWLFHSFRKTFASPHVMSVISTYEVLLFQDLVRVYRSAMDPSALRQCPTSRHLRAACLCESVCLAFRCPLALPRKSASSCSFAHVPRVRAEATANPFPGSLDAHLVRLGMARGRWRDLRTCLCESRPSVALSDIVFILAFCYRYVRGTDPGEDVAGSAV